MALIAGYVDRIGVMGTAEPVGRIWLRDPANGTILNSGNSISCTSGPKLDVALAARVSSTQVEVDTLNTSGANAVADKVRML